MKKFLLIILAGAFTFSLNAQKVPVDASVKTGVLKNGLTYYIKHNKKPEKKVEMYMVLNAGSILEDDDQQGLAHFMEHMNFNGTTHFPDNKLVDFLQSIGIKFGQHLNAYTSFDETVYMLPVPLDKPENLDQGLLVLEDWAFNATLSGEQIDKERGVVLEELRLGMGPEQRMRDRYFPKLFYKSHYAERLPIGKKKLLETFSYDKIRRFHKDWYRPNLTAIIIVGDIDVNSMEKKIIANFGKYKNPANPRERKTYNLPNHKETLVAVETDPDAAFSRVQLIYKAPENFNPKNTIQEYDDYLVSRLYSNMMNSRIQELINSNKPPFTYGSVSYSTILRSKQGLMAYAMTKAGGQLDALKVLIQEIERAKKFGFTQGELDRAKASLLSDYEKNYNDRNKTESRRYVREYINHFLEKEPIPGIEWEYKHFKEVAPSIKLDRLNAFAKAKVKPENRVVIITGPAKEDVGYPSEAEVEALFNGALTANLKPYEDKATIKSLVPSLSAKGTIKKTKTDKKLGTTTWTLSNGVQVTYKKTDFKDDEILFEAISPGGRSVLSDEDDLASHFAFEALADAGLNKYSKTDIKKYLQGKQVNVNLSIGNLSEGIKGSASPKDLGTMMELIYAYFTGLNYDKESYEAYKEKQSGVLGSIMSNPQYYFANELAKFINKENPRFTNIIPMKEDWERVSYKKAYDIYTEKLSDADDFRFFFVGNIDEAKLKSYVEKYIAVLPVKASSEMYKFNGYKPIKGKHSPIIKKGKDPKSMVTILYHGEAKYNAKEALALRALGEIATIKVIEKLREEESGIYGGGAQGSMEKIPVGTYQFTLSFPCGPENVKSLTQNALDELQKLIDKGPEAKDLDKFKKGEINDMHTNIKTNKFWLNKLTDAYLKNDNKYAFLKYEQAVNKLTTSDIQKVAKKYLKGNRIIATLMPEDGWESSIEKETSKDAGNISPQTVIDKYIKATGGRAKLESIKSVSMDNTSKVMGMKIEGKAKMKENPYRFYAKQEVMGQTSVQVFDGEKGYMIQNGKKDEMPAKTIAKLKNKRIFEALNLKAEDYSKVEISEIEKNTYYVLSKDEEKMYFSTSTGLLYKSVSPEAERIILEYTEVDGIKFPAKMQQKAQGMTIEISNSNIQFNKNVSDKDFIVK